VVPSWAVFEARSPRSLRSHLNQRVPAGTVQRMVLLNAWRLEGRRLVSLIAPGEIVLAFTPTALERTQFESLTTLEAKAAGDEDGKSSPFWKAAGVLAAITDAVPSIGDKLADKFENEPVQGDQTSTARTIGRQVDAAPSGNQRYLAVTDRRFLVLHGEPDPSKPLTVIAEVPRAAVRTAEVKSNVLSGSLGRLRVTFTDDSWLEFADALNMGRHRANEVRDALIEGRAAVEGEPGPPAS